MGAIGLGRPVSQHVMKREDTLLPAQIAHRMSKADIQLTTALSVTVCLEFNCWLPRATRLLASSSQRLSKDYYPTEEQKIGRIRGQIGHT